MTTRTPNGGISSAPIQTKQFVSKRCYKGINCRGNFYFCLAFTFLYFYICGNAGFNHG